MRSAIVIQSTNEEFAPVGRLVDFPVLLQFRDLNHTLFSEFFQVCVDVTAAQTEGVSQVKAVGGFFVESLQDTESRPRYKTHFSEWGDPQWKNGDYAISESQRIQMDNKNHCDVPDYHPER